MAQAGTHEFYRADMLADPFPLMARLRTEEPIARTLDPAGREIYLVSGLALIEEATRRNNDFSSRFSHLLMAGGGDPRVPAILATEPLETTLLLTSDDPDHKRYRALVNAAFAAGQVSRLEGSIGRHIDGLIDDFIEEGRVDFVGGFAALLPSYVIAEILGMPPEKYLQVKQWIEAVIKVVGRTGTAEEEVEAAGLIVEFRRYAKETARACRAEPRHGLISDLISTRLDGVSPLTDNEAAALASGFSIAGHETTRNTLVNGMMQLLRHPDQMQALIDEPRLIDNAVEEILRYESPALAMWRIAQHDTELGGVKLAKGATLLLRFDSANRDPERFPDPDRFDIRRKNARMHFSFGAPGIHRCVGQMLARKELTLAFPRLLARLKDIRITEDSVTDYQPSLLIHSIGSLNLTFERGERLGERAEVSEPA